MASAVDVETVLVPVDDSPLSENALAYALDHHPEADVVALNVVDAFEVGYASPTAGAGVGYWDELLETAQERSETVLEDARALAADRGRTVETASVTGSPARAIVDYAEEADADLIVVGSHGRTGISRVLLGSVAETVVRRAPCPVTVVR